MDDYLLALLLSVFVLIPLAGWKITGMVRKLQKMSRKEKELHDELTPKQKEFTQFLNKASKKKIVSASWEFHKSESEKIFNCVNHPSCY